MNETTKNDAIANMLPPAIAADFSEDVQLLMWFENGLITELNALLLINKIDPESSEILKQAKEIALRLFAKTDKCRAFHKNNWGMMDGAED